MVPGLSKSAGTVAGLSQVAAVGHRPRSTAGEVLSDVLQSASPRLVLRTLVPSASDGHKFKTGPKDLIFPVRGSSLDAYGESAVRVL
jgi:hypothetical protein